MKIFKNIIIKDKKVFFAFLLGGVVFTSLTVSAAILVAAKDVSLTSEKTDKGNVQDALDELYSLANSCITCSAGTYADNNLKQCVLCTEGTYSTGMANTCASCPEGYTSDQAATGEDKCYIETTAGKYIATANDTTQTNCPTGSYCPSTKVYYGNAGGNITCPEGYTSDESADSESKCYIETTAGKYIATAKSTTQSTCTAGFYCPSAKVYYGNTGQINACGSGKTSAAGASQASQCYTVKSPYTYTKVGSNGFTGTYQCNNGTGTIIDCSYNGVYGSVSSCQPSNGMSGTFMCTLSSDTNYNLNPCCTSEIGQPGSMGVYGGGLPKTESCSW